MTFFFTMLGKKAAVCLALLQDKTVLDDDTKRKNRPDFFHVT